MERWALIVLDEDRTHAVEALGALCSLRQEQKLATAPNPAVGNTPGLISFPRPRTTNPEKWVSRIKEYAGHPLPEYLLFIGGPDRIPFEVQYQLDVDHMTGRLDFSGIDSEYWAQCRAYADKVLRFERGQIKVEPAALLYGFAIDEATSVSRSDLIGRLDRYLCSEDFRTIEGRSLQPPMRLFDDQATSSALREQLRKRSPALVLTASHGLEFPSDPLLWGALTDSRFVGSAGRDPLSVASIPEDRFAEGSVVFAFACFSAGVPARSDIRHLFSHDGGIIAGAPCVAPLPKRLLGHTRGPVAFIGHVDRATSDSFALDPGEDVPTAFASFCEYSLGGIGTLGQAMTRFRVQSNLARDALLRCFNYQGEALSTIPGDEQVRRWIRYFDAKGYLLLGDPALRVGTGSLG